jgi:mevalonate kinase
MDANQSVLRELGVSSPELERLIAAARDSGASGAKLSGGGRGGNMIAFIQGETPEQLDQVAERVTAALQQAGAVRVLRMSVGSISTLGRLVEPVA